MEPLKVVQHEIPAGMDAQEWGEVLADAYASEGDVLIVAAGLGGCCSADHTDSRQGFTLVENYVKGGGTPTVNEGLPLPAGAQQSGQAGEMAGWLQQGIPLDGGPALYTFVSSERVPFETRATGSGPSSDTIALGGHDYKATLPQGTSAGFDVMVANSALEPIDGTPSAFGTDSADAPLAEGEEAALAKLLATAAGQAGTTLFVQSIGDPTPSSGYATAVARELLGFGASPWVFLSLNGSGPYAFVGNPGSLADGLRGTSAEASAQWSREAGGPRASGEGVLQGLLRRNEFGALAPRLADSVGAPDYELEQVTYQPPTSWPDDETPGEIAATRWFAEALGVGQGTGNCWEPQQPDFRVVYCNQAVNLANLRAEVAKQSYPRGKGFNEIEFDSVQRELEKELVDVETVRSLFALLRRPLGEQEPAVDAQAIAGKELEALPATKGSAVSADTGLVGSIFDAGSYLPEVGEFMGPLGASLDIASEVTQEGAQAAPEWQIQSAADQIGSVVRERLQKMTGELGVTEEIIDSDWGKLSTTAADAGSQWGVNQRELAAATSTIELGISQWMWEAIAPAAFNLVEVRNVPEGGGREIYCSSDVGNPWEDAGPESVFYPLVGFEGKPRSLDAFGMLRGGVEPFSTPVAVSESLAEKMFGTPAEGGAALLAPSLFERAHWTIEEAKSEKVQGKFGPELPPGWCGMIGS